MAIEKSFHPTVLSLLACISALLHYALADYFTNPSNDNTDLSIHYTLGTTVQITWDCSLDSITLIVGHWGGNDVGALLSDVQNSGSYSWKIGELDNINDDQISQSANFVLIIRDPTGTANTSNISGFVNGQLQSRGFVVDSKDVSSTSSSSSLSTLPSSSTSSASSSTLSTATTTSASYPAAATSSVVSSPTPAPADSHDLKTGAKVGIGVGAAVGALLLLGLGTFLGIRWMRRAKRQQAQFHADAGAGPAEVSGGQAYYQEQKPGNGGHGFQSMSELPSGPYSQGSGPVHELGGR